VLILADNAAIGVSIGLVAIIGIFIGLVKWDTPPKKKLEKRKPLGKLVGNGFTVGSELTHETKQEPDLNIRPRKRKQNMANTQTITVPMTANSEKWLWWTDGHAYQITFCLQNVGGGKHDPNKQKDYRTFITESRKLVEKCREQHKTDPFDPEKHKGCIWNWLKE
jgi:hypothetical protein